ncbi:MAG: hypothetical protein V3S69_02555 [Dehalococcoidales bacterium]
MSMNEAQAQAAAILGQEAASAMAQCVHAVESNHCRIPVTVEGAQYIVTVTKMEAKVNED